MNDGIRSFLCLVLTMFIVGGIMIIIGYISPKYIDCQITNITDIEYNYYTGRYYYEIYYELDGNFTCDNLKIIREKIYYDSIKNSRDNIQNINYDKKCYYYGGECNSEIMDMFIGEISGWVFTGICFIIYAIIVGLSGLAWVLKNNRYNLLE